MKLFHFSGVSSSAKIASTGQAGTQAPQSMHSSGWMNSCCADSKSGSSFRGWMQSTGQTSTQAVSFVPTQGSVMIYATQFSWSGSRCRGGAGADLAGAAFVGPTGTARKYNSEITVDAETDRSGAAVSCRSGRGGPGAAGGLARGARVPAAVRTGGRAGARVSRLRHPARPASRAETGRRRSVDAAPAGLLAAGRAAAVGRVRTDGRIRSIDARAPLRLGARDGLARPPRTCRPLDWTRGRPLDWARGRPAERDLDAHLAVSKRRHAAARA